MNIGEVIVALRKQKGIKQKELAANLGISPTYMSLVENNESKPSIILLSQIANYFNLPVTAIIFKALGESDLQDNQQKKYFKAAEPVVNALIEFLLPDSDTTKGKDPLGHLKLKKRKKPIA